MAKITFKGNPVETVGSLPEQGTKAHDFSFVTRDLSEKSLADFTGKNIVLNIFPSIDTPVCANAQRAFNEKASGLKNTVLLCISADLPFAQARFCGAEGLEDVETLSVFRNQDFGREYGVTIKTGPLAGLLARAVVVIDPDGNIKYTQLVNEIAEEPDYKSALEAIS